MGEKMKLEKKRKAKQGKMEEKGKKSVSERFSSSLSGSSLASAWRNVRHRKLLLLLTMLFDVLFLGSLALFNFVLGVLVPSPEMLVTTAGGAVVKITLMVIVYVLMIVVSYSFFKFIIMRIVFSFSVGKKAGSGAGWSLFPAFLKSTLLVFAVFFVAFLFFSALFITTVRIAALAAVRDFFLIIIGVLAYLVFNSVHCLFFQGVHRVRTVVKLGFGLVFNRLKVFFGIVVFTVVAFFVLAGLYYLFDWAVLAILGGSIAEPGVFMVYAVVNTVLIAVLGIGLVAFDRVYLFDIVMRSKRFIMKKS